MSSFTGNLACEDLLYLAPYLDPELERAVQNFVARLPEAEARFATLRYVQRKTIEQVSEEMGYSPRSVYRLRRRVLTLWHMFVRSRGLDAYLAAQRETGAG
jgi:DNA-directed RNA polymerase specialized sigma24 family protein